MKYSVKCECGVEHSVLATQAGSTLTCDCSRAVAVPRLSELRKAVGENSVPQNDIERVKAMIHRGELPTGTICPLSKRPADCVVYVHVQCERRFLRTTRAPQALNILPWLLFGLWGGLLSIAISRRPTGVEVMGRDSSIRLPLRISTDMRAKFMRSSARKLKALLQQTPAYAALLKKYPDADVRAADGPAPID